MAASVELIVGTAVGFVAALTLWYNLLTSKIRETTKDLQAGDKTRLNYIIKSMQTLESKLNDIMLIIKKLEESPDAKTTSELRSNFEELNAAVQDAESIQNAQSMIVLSMRNLRDKVLIILAALGGGLLVVELLSYVLSDLEELVVVIVFVISFVYFVIFYSVFRLGPSYQTGRQLGKLLREKDLDEIGG
ncbi:MAG: hypothetical protein ACLP5V_03850 [Candidatus Bathyarchaeia archaeon]